jgi:hypothetical protein
MRLLPIRFTILQIMFWVAVAGIALYFLKSLVIFGNSPFLDGDPDEAFWAPILFASCALICGAASVALWLIVVLRKRLGGRAPRA